MAYQFRHGLQPVIPGNPLRMGLNQRYLFADADAAALVAAMTVQPGRWRKRLIERTVVALKDAGVWSKIDAIWVLAAHHEQAGRLNWKSPGSYTVTVVNTWTFTTDRGFAGDGISGCGDTGFAPNTNAVQFTRDNAHLGVYQRTGGGNGNEPFSLNNGSIAISVAGGTGGSTRSLVNHNTPSAFISAPAGGSQPIHGVGRRADSSNVSIVRDGVEVTGPSAQASAAINTGNMRIGVRGGTFVTHQVAAAHMGAYLDNTEVAALYAALNAYMVTLGADT